MGFSSWNVIEQTVVAGFATWILMGILSWSYMWIRAAFPVFRKDLKSLLADAPEGPESLDDLFKSTLEYRLASGKIATGRVLRWGTDDDVVPCDVVRVAGLFRMEDGTRGVGRLYEKVYYSQTLAFGEGSGTKEVS